MLDANVAGYYAQGREHERLTEGAGLLEFLRTQELLARDLPPPPAEIVDVGGGSGIHALPLAAAGYMVDVIDPVALHVEQALAASRHQPQAPLRSARVGDARRLELADASADAVLLLGPLYHLTQRPERVQALGEARRVARKGGVVVAAAISRVAPLITALKEGLLEDPEFMAIVEQDLRDGQHRNPRRRPGWFTTAYLHRPDELLAEAGDAGLEPVQVVAVEGVAWLAPDLDERLASDAGRAQLLAAARLVEAEPSAVGATGHLLLIARA